MPFQRAAELLTEYEVRVAVFVGSLSLGRSNRPCAPRR